MMPFRWARASKFWQRYDLGSLLKDYGDKARIIVQGGCWVYFIREYCIEFSVVGDFPPQHLW